MNADPNKGDDGYARVLGDHESAVQASNYDTYAPSEEDAVHSLVHSGLPIEGLKTR